MNDSNDDDVFDPNKGRETEAEPEAKPAKKTQKKSGAKSVKKTKAPAVVADAAPLVIESDVPLPESNAGRKSAFNAERMPFAQLEVGQSFVEALTEGKTADGITVKTVMSQVKKAIPDRIFVVRETEADGVVSARFWRKK